MKRDRSATATGVAVDGGGDGDVADGGYSKSVLKMSFNTAQGLTFPTPTVAGTVDYTDINEGVFILNEWNAPLNFNTVAASTNFSVRVRRGGAV